MRFLQILLALVAARVVWKLVRALFSKPQKPVPPAGTGRAEQRGRVVECEQCHLYVPEERAVVRDGRTFCSAECASPGGRA